LTIELSELSRTLVEDFLKNSWNCVDALVKELSGLQGNQRSVSFFRFRNGQRQDVPLDQRSFFLRASVEYSNPQLTVEEVQGLIAAKMLEVCGNYFHKYGLRQADERDIGEICEALKKPSEGKVVAFLLNTDDIEPDRYSMNPLKESIVNGGQSAFPAAHVKTEGLNIDQVFAQKYEGSLISKSEIERLARHLHAYSGYMDMVDAVKYEHLEILSEAFGVDLALPSLRLPLETLGKEANDGLLHHIIREAHVDYQSIERVYNCMGRSMKNLTTLLTVPHSKKGYGSKRAARGRIYFEGTRLKSVKVTYKTTLLYPNAMDPGDVSVAKADDSFSVEGDKLSGYNFAETPSSPQFFLYSLASPENAVLWHGIGAFGASELIKSYTTTRLVGSTGSLIKGLKEKYNLDIRAPVQFNLDPKHMWVHPVHRNIDASIGCVSNLADLAGMGLRVEHLPTEQFIRKSETQLDG